MKYTKAELDELLKDKLITPSTYNGYLTAKTVLSLMASGKSRKDAIFAAAEKHGISERTVEHHYYNYK